MWRETLGPPSTQIVGNWLGISDSGAQPILQHISDLSSTACRWLSAPTPTIRGQPYHQWNHRAMRVLAACVDARLGRATNLSIPVVLCRMRYRIRTIRELMALWEQWYLFMQPAGTPLPAWEEREVFNNILPWTAASSAGGVSKEHLEFKLYSLNYKRRVHVLCGARAVPLRGGAALLASRCSEHAELLSIPARGGAHYS